jgi:hypothetical protein
MVIQFLDRMAYNLRSKGALPQDQRPPPLAEVVKDMMDNWASSLQGTWGIQYTTLVEIAVNSEET